MVSSRQCGELPSLVVMPGLAGSLAGLSPPLRPQTQDKVDNMKTLLFLYLLCSSSIFPTLGRYSKLISRTHAKKSSSSAIAGWARGNRGTIATKSLTALISSLGLVGTVELVHIAKESATPSKAGALDEMLNSLLAMSSSPTTSLSAYDVTYIACGALTIFALVTFCMRRCVRKYCKKANDDTKEENTLVCPPHCSVGALSPP